MLNVFFGDMPEAIYDTSTYFRNTYDNKWITSSIGRIIIQDVDSSTVIEENVIDSPVLGKITPLQLSGGAKTLLLMAYDKNRVFNASACGDNCAEWILRLADMRAQQKKALVINLRHIMDFGDKSFKIRVVNTNTVVKNMKELVLAAGMYV